MLRSGCSVWSYSYLLSSFYSQPCVTWWTYLVLLLTLPLSLVTCGMLEGHLRMSPLTPGTLSVGVAPVPSRPLFSLHLSFECLLTDVHSSTPVKGSWMPAPTSSATPRTWPPHPDSYKGLRDVAPVSCTLQHGSSPQSASPTGTEGNHLVPVRATLQPQWWK